MNYIVQTAYLVQHRHGVERPPTYNHVGKVNIHCRDKQEAMDMVEALSLMPDRRAWAGVEMFTEGGVKVLLSFSDLERIATEANAVFSAPRFKSVV